MSAIDEAKLVSSKISERFGPRFKAALEAMALAQLGAALAHFHQVQPPGQGVQGRFWKNDTSDAVSRVFGETFSDGESVGFFLAHGVQYGIYLELANNRQNEALRPLVEIYGNQYIVFIREIMK
jgi:hypothetical protein